MIAMLIEPWHGTYEDRPDWDDQPWNRRSCLVLLTMVVLTWAPIVWSAVWIWRHLR